MGQAERLMPMLGGVLEEAGAFWGDLAALGVGTGPGNFTGVRIAVAAARGLALSLGVPALGVSRLEAMAYGRERALCLVDAKRGEVYAQYFAPEGAFAPRLAALGAGDLGVPPGIICIGDRAEEAARLYSGEAAMPRHGLAEAIARIAAERGARDVAARPAPLYLRPADAAPPSDPPPRLLP